MKKRMKYYVRKNKEKRRRQLTEMLATGLYNKAFQEIKTCWKIENSDLCRGGQNLSPALFTRLMDGRESQR